MDYVIQTTTEDKITHLEVVPNKLRKSACCKYAATTQTQKTTTHLINSKPPMDLAPDQIAGWVNTQFVS